MKVEVRLNGDAIPKIFLTPGANPIEGMALSQLLDAADKGTVVVLVKEGDCAVLTVKTDKAAATAGARTGGFDPTIDVEPFLRP